MEQIKVRILRLVLQSENQNNASTEFLNCVLEFSPVIIPINSQCELRYYNTEFNKHTILRLNLKQVSLFNKNLLEIPIGIRVFCEFDVTDGDICNFLNEVIMDAQGYLEADYFLFFDIKLLQT